MTFVWLSAVPTVILSVPTAVQAISGPKQGPNVALRVALPINLPQVAMQQMIELRLERNDAAGDVEEVDERRRDERDQQMQRADDVAHWGALSIRS